MPAIFGPVRDSLLFHVSTGTGQPKAGTGDGRSRHFRIRKGGGDRRGDIGLCDFKSSGSRISRASLAAAEHDRIGIVVQRRQPGDRFGAAAIDAEDKRSR